jgi:hypothetical protein
VYPTTEVVMPSNLWTDEFLTAQRQAGDPLADEVIKSIFEHREVRELNRFMSRLVRDDEIPDDIPLEVRAFLEQTGPLPPWANLQKMRAAERLFNIHGGVCLAALVCASLPECYTMRIGVRILDLTSQLGVHTNRRLHQTAAMVLAVMGPYGLEPRGRGIRQTQKVRLIHAAIRYRVLSGLNTPGFAPAAAGEVPLLIKGATQSVNDVIDRHGFDWQIPRDGYPINQEDMAFTLLTFGHVIPMGMRRLGVKLSDEDYEAFLHCWNVVGFVLGVKEELLAHSEREAEELFERIKARQAGPSPAGARLTDSLLKVVEVDLLRYRLLRPLAPILTRTLVGDETAATLGLDTRHAGVVHIIHRILATLVRTFQILISPFAQTFQPLAPLSARLGHRVVEWLCRVTDDGRVREVAIPPGWR